MFPYVVTFLIGVTLIVMLTVSRRSSGSPEQRRGTNVALTASYLFTITIVLLATVWWLLGGNDDNYVRVLELLDSDVPEGS